MKLTDLAPVPLSLKDEYRKIINDVDHMVAELSNRLHKHLHCAPGCSSCCRSFSVTPLEAALINEQATPASVALLSENTGDICTFLVDDLCLIYLLRPLICRTQGLPIAYIDEMKEQIEVSVCPLNFPEDYPFTHEDLLFLDASNTLLAELNSRYCRETGIDDDTRIPLA